jgi:hypothetical protein
MSSPQSTLGVNPPRSSQTSDFQPAVTLDDLRARIRDHARDSQMLLSGVMKSITIANAAYTLMLLASSSISPALWLPFWLAGFAMITVSFTAALISTLLAAFDPDWRDTFIVFSQTIWEFMTFSVLTPTGTTMPMLENWYLVVALHSAGGVFVVMLLRRRFAATSYSRTLQPLVESYREGLGRSAPRAIGVSVFGLVAWFAARPLIARFPTFMQWQVIVPLLVLVAIIRSIGAMERERASILSFIRTHTEH